ncbi:MAG: cytochrome c [Acidobacteriales bacterium]|nr:cytochrome c [Terriglobales bacterium]
MAKFVLGVVIGVLLVPLFVYLYFSTGHVPTAVSAEPMPFEKKLARMGLQSALDKQAPKSAPFQATEADYVAGVTLYKQNCAVCHGLPDKQKTAIANGMYPKPPQLFVHGVTDDPPGETYWKVANGIRLTGMPGFKQGLSEQQLWQVSLMLANADKLPSSAQQGLSQP